MSSSWLRQAAKWAVLVTIVVAAPFCALNPQPEPPGSRDTAGGGRGGAGGATGGGTGGGVGGARPPITPGADAATSHDARVPDVCGGVDAAVDAASDTDAGDGEAGDGEAGDGAAEDGEAGDADGDGAAEAGEDGAVGDASPDASDGAGADLDGQRDDMVDALDASRDDAARDVAVE